MSIYSKTFQKCEKYRYFGLKTYKKVMIYVGYPINWTK